MFFLKKDPLIIRRFSDGKKRIHLTFDDGPHPEMTPAVLDILKDENATATFFVIGQRGKASPEIIRRILAEGHSLFSHSKDHHYGHFFRGEQAIKTWLADSLKEISEWVPGQAAAFRPPAGVLTPPLVKVCLEMQIPLLMWQHRFYDTRKALTTASIDKCLKKLQSGDIVLLHDWQKRELSESFLIGLKQLVQGAKKQGYSLQRINSELVRQEAGFGN